MIKGDPHPVGSGHRNVIFTSSGLTLDQVSGAVVDKGDSLFGKGRFITLKSGQRVFLKNTLAVPRQKLAVALVNQETPDDIVVDATHVRLIDPSSLSPKQKQMKEIILSGKDAKKLIKRSEKRYGSLPAFNVASTIKPSSITLKELKEQNMKK